VVTGFAVYAFIPSGLSAHLLAIFGRAGIDAGTAVVIGALFGPSQVAARLLELLFARNVHPLMTIRFAIGLMAFAFVILWGLGFSTAAAFCFVIMFGLANGLSTIGRGAVPLALFGPAGYGRTIGRIARMALIVTAAAPLVVAFVAERASDAAALGLTAACAVVALACFLLVRR
jgi:hypothetical protein